MQTVEVRQHRVQAVGDFTHFIGARDVGAGGEISGTRPGGHPADLIERVEDQAARQQMDQQRDGDDRERPAARGHQSRRPLPLFYSRRETQQRPPRRSRSPPVDGHDDHRDVRRRSLHAGSPVAITLKDARPAAPRQPSC